MSLPINSNSNVVHNLPPRVISFKKMNQEDLKKKVKDTSGQVIDTMSNCISPSLKTAITVKTGLPLTIVDPTVNACISAVKPQIKKVVDETIDSQGCFGRDDSCVSKVTHTVLKANLLSNESRK
jgi:hypothetical protein